MKKESAINFGLMSVFISIAYGASELKAAGELKLSKPAMNPNQGNSIESNNKIDKLIDNTNSKLPASQSKKLDAADIDAPEMLKLKKETSKLSLGLYRSEGMGEGKTQSPGVADFAAFLRAGETAYNEASEGNERANKKVEDLQTKSEEDKKAVLGAVKKQYLQKQNEAEKLRVQTAESIRKLIAGQTNPDAKMDLYLRYAEIQIERHGYLLELEIADYNEAYDKWKKDKKGIEPKFSTEKSNAQILKAVDLLRTASSQLPNAKRTDEALFTLGFMLTQLQSDSAALYFDRLVSRFPKSKFMPNSLLALGEHYFANLQFDKALASYQKVLPFKNTPSYNYAVYKLGWTYFNLASNSKEPEKNLNKSLSAFKLIVKLSQTPKAHSSLVSLKDEALKDMVLVYAELGDTAGAQVYFESLGEKKLFVTLLERLAWQNTEKGKYAEAVELYQKLISQHWQSENLPSYYLKLADLQEKTQKRALLVDTIKQMFEKISVGSAWEKMHATKNKVIESRDDALGKATLYWASKFHAEAQKTKAEQTFSQALEVYRVYLKNPKADAYVANFYIAEILAIRSQWAEAGDAYLAALSAEEKQGKPGKFSKQIMENAIICFDNVIAKMPAIQFAEAGKAKSPMPLPAPYSKLLRALDAYTRGFSQHPDALKIAHRAANISYAFGDYPNSNARWSSVVKRFPTSKEAHDGVRMSLKVFVERKEWATAVSEARRFSKENVAGTPLAKDLQTLLKGSLFSLGLQFEAQNKRAEAANLFAEYQKEFPTDEEAPKALYNAANNKFKIGKMDDAIRHLQTLLAQYPTSNLSPEVLFLIASSYETLGEFNESSKNFERLVEMHPTHKFAQESLVRASQERLASGDYSQAIANTQTYLKMFPNGNDVYSEASTQVIAYEYKKDFVQAYQAAINFSKKWSKSNPAYTVYFLGKATENAVKNGNQTQPESSVKEAVSLIAKNKELTGNPIAIEGLRMIGAAQIEVLDKQVAPHMKKEITDAKKMTEQFVNIKSNLQPSIQKYVEVIKLGNAETGITAMQRAAELQEHLAGILMRAPTPQGASAGEVEKFKTTLEKIAIPLQEEAAVMFSKAYEKSLETEALIFDPNKLHLKLSTLKPSEYARVMEEYPAPSYMQMEVTASEATSPVLKAVGE
jgi:cellulose synthase operon protein C